MKGYLWVQGGYLSVLGGYLDGWVDQVGGQDRWVGRSGGWVYQMARQSMWVSKVGRVGRSGRFGLVWSGRLLIQHHQSVSNEGGYRAARAAKKIPYTIFHFHKAYATRW